MMRDRFITVLLWGSLSCIYSIWTSIKDCTYEILPSELLYCLVLNNILLSLSLLFLSKNWGSPWCCINFLYTSFPTDMSGYSALDIGLTVGDPPDNKVCLHNSPSDTEKKGDGRRNTVLSGNETWVGPTSSGYTTKIVHNMDWDIGIQYLISDFWRTVRREL